MLSQDWRQARRIQEPPAVSRGGWDRLGADERGETVWPSAPWPEAGSQTPQGAAMDVARQTLEAANGLVAPSGSPGRPGAAWLAECGSEHAIDHMLDWDARIEAAGASPDFAKTSEA